MQPSPPEIARENLRAVVREYRRATGRSLAAVSREIYGNTSFLGAFLAGDGGWTVEKMHSIFEAFRARWPEGATWPVCRVITFPGPKRKFSPGKKRAA